MIKKDECQSDSFSIRQDYIGKMKIYMKKLFCIAVLLCFVHLLSAQSVVRGRVVDKKGLPIPGARVSVPGDNESVLSEFDGSYKIIVRDSTEKLVVDYVGYNTRKVKLSKADNVVLNKTDAWNDVRGNNWMVALQMVFPEYTRINDKLQPLMPSYGAMFGWCRKAGAYVKVLWRNGRPSIESTFHPLGLWTTGEHDSAYKALIAGAMFRLKSPFHLYVGVGTARWDVSYEVSNMGYIEYDLYGCSQWNLAFDAGIAFKIRYFILNGGIQYYPAGIGVVGNFGIGMSF